MEKVSIAIPAKNIEDRYLSCAKSILGNYDLDCTVLKYSQSSDNYFANDVENRIQSLNFALQSDANVLWMARGGYGCSQIIDHLSWRKLNEEFKWVIGFSDITYFHTYINNVLNLESVHGTMPLNFKENTKESLQSVINVINNESNTYNIDASEHNQLGTANGKVVGGNLAILAAITGSKMQLKTDNKILFIEDVGEHLYKIDRMLYTLKWSGQLNNITGLIVGGFTNIGDTKPPFGKSLEDIILSHVSSDIPVCFNFPAGHIDDNRAIVFNREAQMEVTQNGVVFSQQ